MAYLCLYWDRTSRCGEATLRRGEGSAGSVTTLGGSPSSCHGFVTGVRPRKSGERLAAASGCCKETLPEDGVDTPDKSLDGKLAYAGKKDSVDLQGILLADVCLQILFCFTSGEQEFKDQARTYLFQDHLKPKEGGRGLLQFRRPSGKQKRDVAWKACQHSTPRCRQTLRGANCTWNGATPSSVSIVLLRTRFCWQRIHAYRLHSGWNIRRPNPPVTTSVYLLATPSCYLSLAPFPRPPAVYPSLRHRYPRDGTPAMGHARATRLPQVLRSPTHKSQRVQRPGNVVLASLRQFPKELDPRTRGPKA